MRVGLLGPVVVDDGGTTSEVRGARQQALLAILAVHAGEVVGATRLVDELWGEEPPAKPANALQAVVSRVRRAVGGDVLAARGAGYVLDVSPEDVDAVRFERLVAHGREVLEAGDAAVAGPVLQEALALWRGPVFGGLADQPALRSAGVRLVELRGAAVDAWADAELALGRHEALVAALRGAVEVDPLREGTWARLLLALYRSGRQSEALRAYQRAREVLADQLGIEPGPELRAMEAAILDQSSDLDAPQRPAGGIAGGSAPAPVRRPRTTFFGRHADLDAVERDLTDAPIVTLLGPGGVGKTRLATELAARRSEAGERVVFIDLAPVASGDDVPEAFAVALGGRDQAAFTGSSQDALQRVADHVALGPVLVVVDNCEHVIDDAARAVEAVVEVSDHVRVLATSREALAIPGECLRPVAPLEAVDGVALFIDRARSVRPDFDPGADERRAIADICERLDGLPLAIELAAARMRALPAIEIAARLDDRFRLLTGGARTARPRQQTLRAVVDWSHDLLDEEERHVFARLSAFVGGFALDDAAAVVGGDKVEPSDVGPLVLRLVDKSLVQGAEDHAGRSRFGLLQTLWHYARDRLESTGEDGDVRGRHARHFADLAGHLAPRLRGAGQRAALDRLETEHDNLRAALERAVETGDKELGSRLVGGLGWFWYVRGYVTEGARWSQLVDDLPGPVDPVVEARAVGWSALLSLFDGVTDPSVSHRAEALARATADPEVLATTLAVVAVVRSRSGEIDAAISSLEEAGRIGATIGDRWLEGTAALLRCGLLSATDDVERWRQLADGAVEHFRAVRDDWGLSMALMMRASALEVVGDYDGAATDYSEAHAAAERLDSEELAQHFRIHNGNLCTLAGDPARGRRHQEAAVETARRSGSTNVVGMALNGLGLACRRLGDLDAARAAYEEARDVYLSAGWIAGAALAVAGLGTTAELAGDADTASAHHRQGLDLARTTGDERAVALACEGLAGAYALGGDHERAGRLLGHADARRRGVGAPLPPGERHDVERAEAAVDAALGVDRREALEVEGAEADLDDLLAR